MRKNARFLLFTLPLCFVIHCFYPALAFSYEAASGPKFNIDKIAFELKKGSSASVQLNSVAGQSMKHKAEWGRVHAEYTSRVDWADEVQVKIWVLLFNRQPKKERAALQDLFTVLSGTPAYLNVPEGKGNRSVLFIHPDTLNRYGEVKEIHVELWHKGILEARLDQTVSRKDVKKLNLREWWTRFQPVNGQLFQPVYTPFALDSDNPASAVKLS